MAAVRIFPSASIYVCTHLYVFIGTGHFRWEAMWGTGHEKKKRKSNHILCTSVLFKLSE